MSEIKLEKVTCPYHPETTLIEDYRAGDLICGECGIVVSARVIDVGPEWRVFADDSASADRSRVGQIEDYTGNDNALSTRISGGPTTHDEGGSYAKYQNRRMGGPNEQSLSRNFREISIMCENINLSRNIMLRAQQLFKTVISTRALRGRSSDDVIASCVYIACRQEGYPRSFKEICAVSRVNKREIGRCFKSIVRTLEMSVETVNSEDFIARFCSRLNLDDSIKNLSRSITQRITQLDIVPGRSPVSLATTAICLAVNVYGKSPTFKDVCEATGCSESTVRQLLKHILPRLKEILPNFNTKNLVENIKT